MQRTEVNDEHGGQRPSRLAAPADGDRHPAGEHLRQNPAHDIDHRHWRLEREHAALEPRAAVRGIAGQPAATATVSTKNAAIHTTAATTNPSTARSMLYPPVWLDAAMVAEARRERLAASWAMIRPVNRGNST